MFHIYKAAMNKSLTCFSVFGLNTGKYGPEKLHVWTIFTQCLIYEYFCVRGLPRMNVKEI